MLLPFPINLYNSEWWYWFVGLWSKCEWAFALSPVNSTYIPTFVAVDVMMPFCTASSRTWYRHPREAIFALSFGLHHRTTPLSRSRSSWALWWSVYTLQLPAFNLVLTLQFGQGDWTCPFCQTSSRIFLIWRVPQFSFAQRQIRLSFSIKHQHTHPLTDC